MKQIITFFFIISASSCSFKYSIKKTAKDEMSQLFLGNRIVKIPVRYFNQHHINNSGDTLLLNRCSFVAYKDTLLKEFYIFKRDENKMLHKIKTDSTFNVISHIVDVPHLN